MLTIDTVCMNAIYNILQVYLQLVFFVFFVVNRVIVRVIMSSYLIPIKSSEFGTRFYIGNSPTYWPAQLPTTQNNVYKFCRGIVLFLGLTNRMLSSHVNCDTVTFIIYYYLSFFI